MKRNQQRRGVLVSVTLPGASKRLSAPEWRKELLVSWLFRTCIKLQTSLDRRFLRFGITVQEASVLLRCVQAGKVSPGRLAAILGRDKGKITRFIDRLETSRLVTRDIHPRDRRFSIIKPTGKGKQIARELACVFDNIRKELFAGILASDVRRLGEMLPQLHQNAAQIGSRQKRGAVRQRGRIGSHDTKPEGAQTSQLRLTDDFLTPSLNGHAAHTLPIKQENLESELLTREESSETNKPTGKPVEEHEALLLK